VKGVSGCVCEDYGCGLVGWVRGSVVSVERRSRGSPPCHGLGQG